MQTYLPETIAYLDAACQSLRPQPVLDALNEYYTAFNACADRSKHPWGALTEARVEETRGAVLDFLGLSPKHYFVSFTLNTTYGLNLILNALLPEAFDRIITSEIEHNSVFLPTFDLAQRRGIPRLVLPRAEDGSLPPTAAGDFRGALVVANTTSNIDGRELRNLRALSAAVRRDGGILVLDAAQSMAHGRALLQGTEADALCFSAHKAYAPSLGAIVARRDLTPKLRPVFLGGGMVDDAHADGFDLSAANPKSEHVHTIFEPGLQAYGEIIALRAALRWIEERETDGGFARLDELSQELYEFLKSRPRVRLLNRAPSPVLSFHVDGVNSHLLAQALGDEGIYARSGYFCCHYYLDHICHYPPLLRFSLGLHNREADALRAIRALEKVTR